MKRIDTCVDENGSAGGEGYVHSEYMNLYFISNLEYAVLKMKKKKKTQAVLQNVVQDLKTLPASRNI
jgi:DNA-binding transcriptional regulator YhcF (GntR family)